MNWGSLIFQESAHSQERSYPQQHHSKHPPKSWSSFSAWLKEYIGTCLVSHMFSGYPWCFCSLNWPSGERSQRIPLCLEKNISEERNNLLLLTTHSVCGPGPCWPRQPPDEGLSISHSQWHHELFLCSSRSININSSSQKVGRGTTSSKSCPLSSYSIEEPWPSQTWEVILYHRLLQDEEYVLDQVSVVKGVSWPRH